MFGIWPTFINPKQRDLLAADVPVVNKTFEHVWMMKELSTT